MRLLKHSFLSLILLLTLAGAVFAQSEAQIESDEVKRVGTHLACQCGSCTENVNCMMSAGQCHFCKPARTKIYNMQKEGMNDEQIVAAFVKEYGEKIFRHDPNSYFWLVPYVSLGFGAIVIVLILRKVRGGAHAAAMQTASAGVAPPVDDPDFARYRDAIEKDTSRLE